MSKYRRPKSRRFVPKIFRLKIKSKKRVKPKSWRFNKSQKHRLSSKKSSTKKSQSDEITLYKPLQKEFEERKLLPEITKRQDLVKYVKEQGSAAYNYDLFDKYDKWDDAPLVEDLACLLYPDGLIHCPMRLPSLEGWYEQANDTMIFQKSMMKRGSDVEIVMMENIHIQYHWLLRASRELDRLRLKPLSPAYAWLRNHFGYLNRKYNRESYYFKRNLRARL